MSMLSRNPDADLPGAGSSNCRPQDGNLPGILGNRGGHVVRVIAPPSGQTPAIANTAPPMGGPEGLWPQGTRVTHRLAQPRLQGSSGSFLRRMIDLLWPCNPHQGNNLQFRLNVGFRADLAWWQCFVQSWNGTFFLPPSPLRPALEMSSDASGSWGCGAWFRTSWFQLQWSTASQELPITVKELLPILVAGVVWGCEWSGHRVEGSCTSYAF